MRRWWCCVGALLLFTVDEFGDGNKCTVMVDGAVERRTIARDGSHWGRGVLVNSFTYLATAKNVKRWRPWKTKQKKFGMEEWK